jgi:hypothetical protein
MIRSSDKGKSQNINEVITDAMDVFMYINEVISYTIKNKPVNDLCCAAGV